MRPVEDTEGSLTGLVEVEGVGDGDEGQAEVHGDEVQAGLKGVEDQGVGTGGGDGALALIEGRTGDVDDQLNCELVSMGAAERAQPVFNRAAGESQETDSTPERRTSGSASATPRKNVSWPRSCTLRASVVVAYRWLGAAGQEKAMRTPRRVAEGFGQCQ